MSAIASGNVAGLEMLRRGAVTLYRRIHAVFVLLKCIEPGVAFDVDTERLELSDEHAFVIVLRIIDHEREWRHSGADVRQRNLRDVSSCNPQVRAAYMDAAVY